MIYARPTAPRLQSTFAAILITAAWTGFAAAQSAATSGDQWRPAGSTSSASTQSAATSGAEPTWRLPNSQSNAGDAQLVDDPSNPLRQTRKPQPAAKPPEPRAFQAPANASPMTAGKSAASYNNAAPPMQQRTNPMAVAARPGTVNAQGYITPRPLPNLRRPTCSVRTSNPAINPLQTINPTQIRTATTSGKRSTSPSKARQLRRQRRRRKRRP